MLLVLEGPNLAGKSTLAELVQPDPDYRLTRGVPDTKRSIYEEYLTFDGKADKVADPNVLVVADRWHLGQLIYPQILRDTPPDYSTIRVIDTILRQYLCGVFVVLPDVDTLVARYDTRGDELATRSQVIDEFYAWRDLKQHAPWLCYGIVSSGNDEMVRLCASRVGVNF